MNWRRRIWLWLFLALLIVLICSLSPLKELFDEAFIVTQLHKFGGYSALIFILIYILVTLLGLPSNVMTVAGGAVFGLLWGSLYSIVGATLGAVGAFWVARHLLHRWAKRYLGQHPALSRFDRAISHNSFSFILAVRFTPISPFSLVNFLFGLTSVNLKPYIIGTFLGIIPSTLAYAWLGVTGSEAFHGGDRLPFAIALTFLTLLSLLPIMARKRGYTYKSRI